MILKVPGLGPFKRVQRCARSMQPAMQRVSMQYYICLDQNEHMPYDLGDWVSENEGGKIEMFGSSVTEVHLPAL